MFMKKNKKQELERNYSSYGEFHNMLKRNMESAQLLTQTLTYADERQHALGEFGIYSEACNRLETEYDMKLIDFNDTMSLDWLQSFIDYFAEKTRPNLETENMDFELGRANAAVHIVKYCVLQRNALNQA